MDDYLKVSDGIRLRYKRDIVDNAKAVIVVNHGFAEHIGRYDHVVKRLNEFGYSTYRYDLRGHGNTEALKGHIDSYKEFISDCNAIVDLAINENEDLDIFMLGHSMGGMVTCLYALTFPDKLKGQIFSGAAVNTLPQAKGINAKILKLASTIAPKAHMKNVVEDKICSVDSVVVEYKKDPLVLKKATFKFYYEFLIESIKFIDENISNYNYPCLILHGEEDSIVPVDISEYLYENISSKDKELIIYENLFHEILNEYEKDEILETIGEWLDIHI